jgi:DUF309 family protein family protein
VIRTLPLAARNRLAELILHAVSDASARDEIVRLGAVASAPREWLGDEHARYADVFSARVRAAARALERLPLAPRDHDLDAALVVAASLFDAGLHFEVHELLEPHWRAADGRAREALQGLIQIAVGYQHFANGNVRGARALLEEGASRLDAGALSTVDLAGFAAAVRASLANGTFAAPRFPRLAHAA